jgi:hypothetical protein
MSFDFSKLSDKERKQYFTLDSLFEYSFGASKGEKELSDGIIETITDWKKIMGGRGDLQPHIAPYLSRISIKDREAARNLYFLISPLFFYIHVLYELSRSEWRNSNIWSGMFCERIVKNLLSELHRMYKIASYDQIEKSKFENRLGKMKSELESRQFRLSEEMFNLMKVIYSLRDTRGPHDVPPPEPIRAQISASQCLPVYIDYLEALIFLKNDLLKDYKTFVLFFSNLTETKISLVFGEEGAKITLDHLVKNVLYREGFFRGGKTLGEAQHKLGSMGYNFKKPAISSTLFKMSKGKDAILTRKGKRGHYTYYERYPPSEVFRSTI